jgi:hypothetical protein
MVVKLANVFTWLQKACGRRMVALGPGIGAYALRQRLAFRLVGVERPVKQEDAKRRRPNDEGSLHQRCFLPPPDKNIFATLALVRAGDAEIAKRPLPVIRGCPGNGPGGISITTGPVLAISR